MKKNVNIKTIKISPMKAGSFVGLITFSFFSVIINTQPHGWISWYQLVVSGQEVQGTITRKQPETHQTCYFEYIINSKQYKGVDEGCHAEVGQSVTLKYLPVDPSFSTSSSPVEQLVLLILAPLALSVFGGVMTAWRASRHSSEASKP